MRSMFLAALLATTVLAGCIGGDDDSLVDPDLNLGDLFAGKELWLDPQNAPHGAWNWPTLNHPANGSVPDLWKPIPQAELPAAITGMERLAPSPGIASGGGIAMFGSIAYVPGYGPESHVVDVSDPADPQVISTHKTDGSERGAAMIAYPDGRLAAVVSTSAGFNVWNLTDPTDPVLVASETPTQGGHKLGVVPGTPFVYNAASGGGGQTEDTATGVTEIYDLTDMENPVHVQDFANGFACHHVYFWNDASEEKYRAICAGIEYTQLWDTTDPADPKVIVSIPVHHGVVGTPSGSVPLMAFSHYAALSQDGTTLIVGDEMGGGSVPPGCGVGASTPARHASTPLGAIWFYDVTDEMNPTLKGWFSPGHHLEPDNAMASCTAHHGRIVPAEGRDLLAMAFYGAGVALVDFTDPTMPEMVDQYNGGVNIWEVWYNNGYLFTGDLNNGFEVLSLK